MAETHNRINELRECVENHVDDVKIWLKSCELRVSSEFGCGVFATRDIKQNELLFGDKPLMLGPMGNKHEPIVCVMCYERISNDFSSYLCSGQCGLILCGQIKCAEKHKNECQLLQKWKPKNPNELSFTRIKGMFVIRSLFLDEKQKKFLNLMQKNFISFEKELYFANEFDNFPQCKETLDYLRATSAAINTNAFKCLYRSNSSGGDVNVSSFYPIMSLINHKCSPNSRHDIDNEFVSRVIASRPIKKDEQIFMSYSQLLWGTNSRRMHLMMSKQFLCTCDRCSDSTEYSTYLSAIRCQDKTCNGPVLPIEPINFKSDAKCNSCERICENKRFLQVQEMATSICRNFSNSVFTLDELKHFLEMRVGKLVPHCNQFVVEAKLSAIWKCEPTSFEGMVLEFCTYRFNNTFNVNFDCFFTIFYNDTNLILVIDLSTMKGFCEDILRILEKLQIGESSLKGHLAYKLYIIRKKLCSISKLSSNQKPDPNTVNIIFFIY